MGQQQGRKCTNQLIFKIYPQITYGLNSKRLDFNKLKKRSFKTIVRQFYQNHSIIRNLSSFFIIIKNNFISNPREEMSANKQNIHNSSKINLNEQNSQINIFYKSYLKCLKKNIQNTHFSRNQEITIFDLKKASSKVSLELFLQRIFSFFKCGKQAYVCSLCFIERFLQSQYAKTENIKLSIQNIFKILSIALLLATKNFDDFYYSNAYYARVCGLTLSEINNLEKQFIKSIDFNVFLQGQQYSYYERIINQQEKLTRRRQSNQMDFQNNRISKSQNSYEITDEEAAKQQQNFKTAVEITV